MLTRALAKTATFAVLHFAVGFGVTYAFTGSVVIATGVALVEPLVNTVVFFFHERAWAKIDLSRLLPLRPHSVTARPEGIAPRPFPTGCA